MNRIANMFSAVVGGSEDPSNPLEQMVAAKRQTPRAVSAKEQDRRELKGPEDTVRIFSRTTHAEGRRNKRAHYKLGMAKNERDLAREMKHSELTKWRPTSKKKRTLAKLLEHAAKVVMTPEEREAQRRSFAYGNVKIANDHVTREMIDDAAELVKS